MDIPSWIELSVRDLVLREPNSRSR